MAAALTKALGQEVRYNAVSPAVYRGFGFPGAEDLGNMFQFKRDFESIFCGARSLVILQGAQSIDADVRVLARRKRGPHPGREGFPAGVGRVTLTVGSPDETGMGTEPGHSMEVTGLFIARRTRA